uniref:Peroxiredoxin-like 2A n=1 Tax=Salmo trutta TaxID=8032 RepID=A0A673WBX8_SALTR
SGLWSPPAEPLLYWGCLALCVSSGKWLICCLVILQEAAELSSLKPQLEELGVPLYAVVKENIGTEIQNFRTYFNEIFIDQKMFLWARERKMGLLAFLRLGVWMNGLRAFKNGFLGNVFGEGFVLGGLFVIGAGQRGILLEHWEKEFGGKVNILDVLKAARKVQRTCVFVEVTCVC